MVDKRHPRRRRRRTYDAGVTDEQTLQEARRILEARARVPGELRESLETVADWFRLSLGRYLHEVFAVAWLDRDQCLIAFREFPFGATFAHDIDQREIIRSALESNAVTAVFAHNHTYGKFNPLAFDNSATAELAHALGLIGIRVRDHIVVTAADPPVSMAEHGLLRRVAKWLV